MTLEDGFAQRVIDRLAKLEVDKLGIAVSGGGDSIALLRLALYWAHAHGTEIFAYTVNHGLRPEAAAEAGIVGDLCASLSVPHKTLMWTGWDRSGNLSQEARNARYHLMAEAARADGVSTLALGHTLDDQAETFLMALTRRSGVDGLAGMPETREANGVTWVRPLLSASRKDLRAYLREIGQEWVDDPTNEDEAYERVRMRKAKADLEALGLTADALSDVAGHMQSVQSTLRDVTRVARQEVCTPLCGAISMDRPKFLSQPAEIRRRLMLEAIRYAAPSASAPRRDSIAAAMNATTDVSLAGCLVLFKPKTIWITREPNAVISHECAIEEEWDSKWRVSGRVQGHDLVIRPLGENGLKLYPDWRELGLPRQVLLTTPAIWQGDRLIDAPMLGQRGDWSAEVLFREEVFYSSRLGH